MFYLTFAILILTIFCRKNLDILRETLRCYKNYTWSHSFFDLLFNIETKKFPMVVIDSYNTIHLCNYKFGNFYCIVSPNLCCNPKLSKDIYFSDKWNQYLYKLKFKKLPTLCACKNKSFTLIPSRKYCFYSVQSFLANLNHCLKQEIKIYICQSLMYNNSSLVEPLMQL